MFQTPVRRPKAAFWIAALAPSSTALVAIVMIALLIRTPASHEPAGVGAGNPVDVFSLGMPGLLFPNM
jgi:hypothetical protein